jgi:hypothetical protein
MDTRLNAGTARDMTANVAVQRSAALSDKSIADQFVSEPEVALVLSCRPLIFRDRRLFAADVWIAVLRKPAHLLVVVPIELGGFFRLADLARAIAERLRAGQPASANGLGFAADISGAGGRPGCCEQQPEPDHCNAGMCDHQPFRQGQHLPVVVEV